MLDEAGISYVALKDHFGPATPDDEWLAMPGRECWPVVTRDKKIRYKPNEWEAYRRANVIGFVFTAGDISAAKTGELLVKAMPSIRELSARSERPAMDSIDGHGNVRPLALSIRRRRRE